MSRRLVAAARWWLPPVIGIGAVAIANTCLFVAVAKVRPAKVEARTYASGAQEDGRLDALRAFAARGWRIEAAADGAGADLRLVPGSGPAPARAEVRLRRPDAPDQDRDLAWPDPAAPLRLALPRPGVWDVQVECRDAADACLIWRDRLVRP